MTKNEQAAIDAVKAGGVFHQHPFTWVLDVGFLHVKPKTLQRLASRGKIKVLASSGDFHRPVVVVDDARAKKKCTEVRVNL